MDAAMKTTRVQDPLEAHLSRYVHSGLQSAFDAALAASARVADEIGGVPSRSQRPRRVGVLVGCAFAATLTEHVRSVHERRSFATR